MLQYHHEEQLDFLLKVLFLWILFPRVSHHTINTVLNRKFKHQYLLVSVSGFIHFVTDRGIFIKRDIFINLMET